MKQSKVLSFLIGTAVLTAIISFLSHAFWEDSAFTKFLSFSLFSKKTIVEKSESTNPGRFIASSNYCFLCQFPEMNFPNANNKNVCEDLHSAVCGPNNPSSLATNKKQEADEEMFSKNRDKGAQSLGYKDFDDGLKKRLAEAGFKLNPRVQQGPEWDMLKDGLISPSGGELENIPDIFTNSRQCQLPPVTGSGRKNMQRSIQDLERQLQRNHESSKSALVQYYKDDLPAFLETQVMAKCKALDENPEVFPPEKNTRLVEICKNSRSIRREALMLYKKEGTPGYEAQAQSFINKYFPPQPVRMGIESDAYPPSGRTSALHLEYTALRRSLELECNVFNEAQINAAKKIAGQYVREVQTSRAHVESTIGAIYTPARQKAAQQSLNILRADIQSMIPQLTQDREKQSRIIDQYNNLELYWLKTPNSDQYTKNQKGVDVLKRSMYPEPNPSDTASLFNDPTLSFFRNPNAYYSPMTKQGGNVNAEHVNINPGFLNLLETNPYAFSSIMAHELGHKIGPEISKINKHDMTPEFKELMACYKGRDSIRMLDHQADEVIADYVSSEVMAHQVSKLDPSKRRSAIMAMASTFCEGEHEGYSCKEDHPEGLFRVNGILASNPKIRKAMGCSGNSKDFKNCSIDSVSLSEPSSTEATSGLNSTQTSDEAGGVQ